MATTCERCGRQLDGRNVRATLCLACRQERDRELSREWKQRRKDKKRQNK